MSTLLGDHVADTLADPAETQRRHEPPGWWAQSLAAGALGVALLHVERSRTGHASWRTAHEWLAFATAGPIDDGPGSHMHYGAPALTYVLHHAGADQPDRYARALTVLEDRVARLTTARIDQAHRRIDRGDHPALCEFDAIRGLTGLGAVWLRRDPHGQQLHAILEYLVRLTEPLPGQAELHRPGWWTHLAPNGRRAPEFPAGHANNGLSHGIAGPLALLALAARAGHQVPGHRDALRRVLDWFDTYQRAESGRTWWPYWITDPTHLDAGAGPGRPSWCYGAPGIARAQQLAGIALDDPARVHTAEAALLSATTAPNLTDQLDNPGLCHGLAGALLLTHRAATDSTDPRLHHEAVRLHELTSDVATKSTGELGLFEGLAGTALALGTGAQDGQRWDACLLTS